MGKENAMTVRNSFIVLLSFLIATLNCLSYRINSIHRIFQSSLKSQELQQIPNKETLEKDKSSNQKHFISNIIEQDLSSNKNGNRIVTRFPPEPNGYLHLGHAKSICLNFGLASIYNGVTNMRFDDTNPAKEDIEYVKAILDDVRWLVKDKVDASPAPWNGTVKHASDYFDIFYKAAIFLILNGKAYVDNLSPEEMKQYRGTLTEVGSDSPYRTRTIEENLQLFESMKNGELPDGTCVLRAKIDNKSPNINMRDPTLYRIKRATHPMTGDTWCIYPMYDFAHAISDAIEGITHSLCTLEFADHRPLYDWVIDSLSSSDLLPYAHKGWAPTQIEFSRLNLQFTVLSKRKLIQLVQERHVDGWDDPRMPTICGVRRRGYPAAAIRLFCDRIGISKAENNIDMSVLEDCVRETLDFEAKRSFAVLKPLKVTITNWEDGVVLDINAEYHPKRPEFGSRVLKFEKNLVIDRDDFFDTGLQNTLVPPKGYKRLLLGGIVRLKNGFVISCDSVIRDSVTNEVIELLCSYDMNTRGGVTPPGSKKAKGIIQWVSQSYGVRAEVRLYDRLFLTASPGKNQPDGDFLKDLNPNSIRIYYDATIEPSIRDCLVNESIQFERVGYFCLDPVLSNTLSNPQRLVFNMISTLRDTWSENAKKDNI